MGLIQYFQGEKGSEGPGGPVGAPGISVRGEKVQCIKQIAVSCILEVEPQAWKLTNVDNSSRN